jgi:hypothetical protein
VSSEASLFFSSLSSSSWERTLKADGLKGRPIGLGLRFDRRRSFAYTKFGDRGEYRWHDNASDEWQ